MKRSQSKSKIAKDQKDFDEIVHRINKNELTIHEAMKKYNVNHTPLYERLQYNRKEILIFTKEQELFLKDHITHCCKHQQFSSTRVRKMAYEYATKLPGCPYPKSWDNEKMACITWFLKFRCRHPELKKVLKNNPQTTCICIMGCHMGPEGRKEFDQLKASVLIARVYRYLEKEYNYMKDCNDLSLLVNISRRTAEATGVCEQTISSVLDEEKHNSDMLKQHLLAPEKCRSNGTINNKSQKKKNCSNTDHDYAGKERGKKKRNEVEEDTTSGNSDTNSNMDKMAEVNEQPRAAIPSKNVNADLDSNTENNVEAKKQPSIVIPNIIVSADFNSNMDKAAEVNEQSSIVIPNDIVNADLDTGMDRTKEVTNSNTNNAGEVREESITTSFNHNQSTDFDGRYVTTTPKKLWTSMWQIRRLQQHATSIETVKVEILDDDTEEQDVQEDGPRLNVDPLYIVECKLEPNIESNGTDIKSRIIFTDNEHNRLLPPTDAADELSDDPIVAKRTKLEPNIKSNGTDIKSRIIFTDNEPNRLQPPADAADELSDDPIVAKRAKIMSAQNADDKMSTDSEQAECTEPDEPKETKNKIIEPKSYRDLCVVSKGKNRQTAIDTIIAMFPRRKSTHKKLLYRKVSSFVDVLRRKKKKYHCNEKRFLKLHKEWLNTEIDWFDEENNRSSMRFKECEQTSKAEKKESNNWNLGLSQPENRSYVLMLSPTIKEATLQIATYIKKVEPTDDISQVPTRDGVPKKLPDLLKINALRRKY